MAIGGCGVGWAQATLPNYDPLNYTIGRSLSSQTGWTKLNSGDSLTMTSGNLSYVGLPTSSGNKVIFDGAGIDAAKLFTQQTTGTVYYSFLLNVTSLGSLNTTGGYFTGLNEGTSTNYGATIWTRKDAGGTGFNIGINARTTAANTAWISGIQSLNTTLLIVLSYQIVSGTANDIVKIWINPILGTSEPAVTATATNNGTDLLNLNRIFIRQDASTTTPFIEMDELRIGTSWSDVAPISTPAPVVTGGSPTCTVGTPFTYQISATNSPTSYAVSSGTLPDGLTLNTTTGEISGTPTTAGAPSVGVTATNAGGTSAPATLNFTIASASGQSQTITFGALSSKTYGDATFDLTATASSGLEVGYTSSNTSVATVTGSTVTIVGAGSADITASQSGNGTYNPATSVIQSLTVVSKELTLPDAAVAAKAYDGTNAAVITGTLSGVINADDVTLVGAGIFADVNVGTGIAVTSNSSLSGTKAGNYTLTQPTGLSGDITKASQTITFGALASKFMGDPDFGLTGTASSSLTLTYSSSNPSVATISGATVTIHGIGSTIITASQSGSSNYDAAVSVDQELVVESAPIAAWNFYGYGSVELISLPALVLDPNLVYASSSITRGSTAAWSAASNSFRTVGFKNEGISTSNTDYFQITLLAKAGKKVSLTSLDAKLSGTSSFAVSPGVSSQFAYSLDGTTFTLIGSPESTIGVPATLTQINLSSIPDLQNVSAATTITIRYYASGQTATGGWGFYSINADSYGLTVRGTVDVDTSIGGQDLATNQIYVTNGQLIVAGVSEYTVFNMQGMQVASVNTGNSNRSIPLKSGVYFVKTANAVQKVMVK